jgi:integrase
MKGVERAGQPCDARTKEPTMTKLTQTTVGALLKRRPDGAFTPSRTRDHEVGGLLLVIGVRKATWAVDYKPHGTREDGRRHAKVRMTLGDAMTMPLPDARTAARAVKLEVAQGRNPHAEKLNARALAIAERAAKPMTLAEALDGYEQDMLKRREPSETSRRQEVHYARKAIALMNAGDLAVDRLHVGVVRKLVRMMDGSASEVRHVYGALSRFCGWMVEEGLIGANPCDALPRRQRPKLGSSRDHVPSLAELKAVWAAVEDEPMRDLVRFMLLLPLRRDEVAGLLWSEVDLDCGRIIIAAERMKNREAHELPLSKLALAILAAREPAKPSGSSPGAGALVFPSGEGKSYDGWNRLLTRIRKALEQADAARDARFNVQDIRRAFATHLAERFDENLLDLMLAHRPASRSGSGAAYQKAKRLNERPAVMAVWADMVAGEEAEASPPNVVPFMRAG